MDDLAVKTSNLTYTPFKGSMLKKPVTVKNLYKLFWADESEVFRKSTKGSVYLEELD